MKKRNLIYVICILLTAAGCNESPLGEERISADEGNIVLSLDSRGLATRGPVTGVVAGEEALNENLVKTVDCFLYKNGETGSAAKFHARITTSGITYSAGTATASVKLSASTKNALFGTGNTCTAYTIVNLPEGIVLPPVTSVRNLKGIEISAEGFASNVNDGKQDSFVMDGQSAATLSGDGKTASADVRLYRAASKIRLVVTDVENIVVDEAGNTWTSNPSDMRVYFHNGVKKTRVDVSEPGCAYTVQPADYFSFPTGSARRMNPSGTDYTHTPFYSYSSAWEKNSPEESYMVLLIPWKKQGEINYRTCYYQVPVNLDGRRYDRNHYYLVRLKVGILGSFAPEDPLELEPGCRILDWGDGSVEANLEKYRYLVVDRTRVEMNNVNTASIPYSSSHEAEITSLKVETWDYTGNIAQVKDVTATAGCTVSLADGAITVDHVIENRENENDRDFDYAPYTITFRIKHRDSADYFEDITVVQYPMMYIVAHLNSDYVSSHPQGGPNKGYVIINNNTSSGSGVGAGEFSVQGLTGQNKNPNMFVITVTALNGDSDYIIGDPRTTSSSTYSWSVSAPALEGGTRQLSSSYLPAGNSDYSKKILAPKLRFASSFGVSLWIRDRDKAFNRCASYQEDGYPAGRWRLPTYSEIEYATTLSSLGMIQPLFNVGGYYWTATNAVSPLGDGKLKIVNPEDGATYARCVYDEWYWHTKTEKTQFTWGEKKK